MTIAFGELERIGQEAAVACLDLVYHLFVCLMMVCQLHNTSRVDSSRKDVKRSCCCLFEGTVPEFACRV
jgi:hypothetical protein